MVFSATTMRLTKCKCCCFMKDHSFTYTKEKGVVELSSSKCGKCDCEKFINEREATLINNTYSDDGVSWYE